MPDDLHAHFDGTLDIASHKPQMSLPYKALQGGVEFFPSSNPESGPLAAQLLLGGLLQVLGEFFDDLVTCFLWPVVIQITRGCMI